MASRQLGGRWISGGYYGFQFKVFFNKNKN